jgi:hypothetical protein
MYFFKSAEYSYLEQREPISTLKNLSFRKYSIQKLIQFSQCNNELDVPASNKDCFLLRDTCVPHLAEFAYLEQTEPISTFKILSCRKYSFQKLTQFSQGNNVLENPASNTDGFLSRHTCISSTQLNRHT